MPDTFAPMRATRAAMFAAVCIALAAAGHSYMSGMEIPLTPLLYAFGVIGAFAWLAAGRRRGPYGITASLLAAQGVLHLAFAFAGSRTPAPAAGHRHAPGSAVPERAAEAGSLAGTNGVAELARAHAPTNPVPLGPPPHPPGLPTTDGVPHVSELPGSSAMDGMAGLPGSSGMDGMDGLHHMAGWSGSSVMDGLSSMDGLTGLVAMAGHGGLGMIAAHLLAALFCAGWLAWGEAAVFRLARALGATALLAARPLARALVLVRTHVASVPPRPVLRRTCERPRRLRGAVHAHAVVRRGPPGGPAFRATAPGLPARA
ncbi:hypothetical protein ACFWWA_13185 [Streptomyces goshikiensis]|uniref:hypothetical protein n=1 Tax=Streptomyces goshikiensis TaxID=1942 RepID=UPI00365361E5